MEQITLDALESALAPIEAIGKSEITFNVNGSDSNTIVTLRMLLPEEGIMAQRYASEVLDDKNQKSHDALEYLERFKIGLLSYSLVAIGPLDLHDVKYIETGEKLETGVAIKEPTHIAMRRLLLRWTQDIRTRMFNKHSELLTRVEMAAEKAIEFDPVDLALEIERVEKRLEMLKTAQEQDPNAAPSIIRDQVKDIVKMDKMDSQGRREAVDKLRDKQAGIVTPQAEEPVASEQAPEQAPVKESFYEDVGTPPPEQEPPQAQPEPLQAQPEPQTAPQPTPQAPPAYPDQSFVDTGDTDGMLAAVEAENQRLLAARAGTLPPAPGAMNAMRAEKVAQQAPHLAARVVSEELQSEELQILQATRKAMAEPTEKLGDVDVFKAPTETLDRRPPADAPVRSAAINKSNNPRFTPVKKGL